VPDRGDGLAAFARRRRDDLLIVAAALLPLALFLARERQIAGAAGFPLDDAWIHLHFARNIAEGAGFSFNPGTPVAGSTAPLWTLLLAAGAFVATPAAAMAKVFGVVATLGAALLVRRASLVWGAHRYAALLAAVAFLWTGPVAWGALSGMEVSLAALLVAATLLAHARGHPIVTAVFSALAVLARPEALLLVPFLVLGRPLTVGRLAAFALVSLAALAPVALFSLKTAGALYPATATAKVEGGLLGWLAGVREPTAVTWLGRLWAFLTEWVGWLTTTHWLLALALAPALIVAWRRAGRPLGVVTLTLVAHPLGMALLAPYRGPGFQEGRYSIHLLPLALIVLAVAASAALVDDVAEEALAERPTARRPARVAGAVAIAWLVLALVALVPAATRYGWAVQNINAMQVHLGRWVDAHLPKMARLAVNDIGAIAFFSRRDIIDLMGLVTPDIVAYRRRGESGVMEYVTETCPDYVIIFPAWFPRLAASADTLAPIYRVRLERNEVAGAAEMVVYRLLRCAV
jgi:arabinofuranosyltransferase